MRFWTRVLVSMLAATAATCGGPDSSEVVGVDSVTLTVTADAPNGGEALTCFGFDATMVNARAVSSVRWTVDPGVVTLHHAALYAVPEMVATGPCDQIPPFATGLHIFAPGNDALELPADMALSLPPGTSAFVVQVHAIRSGAGPAVNVTAHIGLYDGTPSRLAAFVSATATVPEIAPGTTAQSGARCPVGAPAQTVMVWPHMHIAGREFHAAVLHADGTRTPIVDVAPWVFEEQHFYPATLDLFPGDLVQTSCTWTNTGSFTIEPGPRTENEMCTLGVLVWPADAAFWAGGCS